MCLLNQTATCPKGFDDVQLGLEKNKNLFVDDKGSWTADYIPAYVRRYPFILATADENKDNFTVCIDESYPGFNTAKEGKALFDDKGEQNLILDQAVDFLKDYQSHVTLTTRFCENLSKLDILEPMQANIERATGGKDISGRFYGCESRKTKST